MSFQSTAWAQRCHVGSGTAKAVLAYLADRASEDGTGAYPKVKTICEVTEFSERTVRSALKLLESRGFIRPGDQRHAAIAKNGRTRPKQYRATVWDLCVDQDPEVLNYLARTNHDDDEEPESALGGQPQNQGKNEAQNRGAAAAPLEETGKQTCAGRTSGGAASAPLYKPSGNNHQYPLVPSGHSPKTEHPQPEALELVASLRALLEELGLPVPQEVVKPTKRELQAAQVLVKDHGKEEPVALARWALAESDGWWRPHLRSCRQLARHWDEVFLQRARSQSKRKAGSRDADPHKPNTVCSPHAWGVPVYGFSKLGLAACQAHLEGDVRQESCPVCSFDVRNRPTHMSEEQRQQLQRQEEAQMEASLKPKSQASNNGARFFGQSPEGRPS